MDEILMKTSSMNINNAIKTALYKTLMNVLNPDPVIRKTAEDRLKALEVVEDYGTCLVDAVCDSQQPDEFRTLASLMLKKYIECHWVFSSEKFQPPEVPLKTKMYIKSVLPIVLSDPCTSLRSTVAHVIAGIAQWDYPNDWRDFMLIIMNCIRSRSEYRVHGGMRVLLEYVNDINHHLEPDQLPELFLNLFEVFRNNHGDYSVRTRTRALEIFKIITYNLSDDDSFRYKFEALLCQFLEVILENLDLPDGPQMDCGLRSEVLESLTILVCEFRKLVLPYLPNMLPKVWQLLVQASEVYINSTDSSDKIYEENGDVINISTQLRSIFSFINGICSSKDMSQHLHDVLPDLFFHIIVCMQITPIMLLHWNEDVNKYIEDDNEDSFCDNVKVAAVNCLNEIMENIESNLTIAAFCNALCRHINTSEVLRNSHNDNWWKSLEASMFALGGTNKRIITEYKQNRLPGLDLKTYLSTAAEYTTSNNIPLLLSRCVWLCGRFTEILPRDIQGIVITSSVRHLHSDQLCVQISAIKAIIDHCNFFRTTENSALILCHLSEILNGLFLIVEQNMVLLNLCLRALLVTIQVDEVFSTSSSQQIIPMVLNAFVKYGDDINIGPNIEEIIKVLAKFHNMKVSMLEKFGPVLVSIINSPLGRTTLEMQHAALKTLGLLVKYHKGHLADDFMRITFPAAVSLTLKTSDYSVLQAGGDCMKCFLLGVSEQVCTYCDSEGQHGIDFIIEIIMRLLDPEWPERTAQSVGRLMIVLITRAGAYVANRLESLLRAILSKMLVTGDVVNMQGLILTFAYLMYTQLDAVLAFLTNIPGPDGQSALSFVMTEWIYQYPGVSKEYEHKISVVAFIRLLEYGLTNETSILHTINVPEARNDTSYKWTQIPILAKILKLLISDVMKFSNTEVDNMQNEETTSQSLSDLESEEDARLRKEDSFEDSAIDPVCNIQISTHVISFLNLYRKNKVFVTLLSYLNESEINDLCKIGINTSS